MQNFVRESAKRPPPESAAVRRELTAARREVRKLADALERSGGQELFAGDPSSLTARLGGAQSAVSDCEARLHTGRAHLSVVPDNAAPTLRPRPAVAELLDSWQTAHAIATGPTRPQGPGPLQAEAQLRLQDATARAAQLATACAMLPQAHRLLFTDAIQATERQQAYQLQQLHELADPDHPSAATLRAWEMRHPDVDQAEADARAALDAEVTEWALCPGLGFMPPLPPNVSPADREVWLTASATQLAYRERYNVTESSPLGAEPWPADQARAWNHARMELARVGVHVTSATDVAAQVTSPRARRSLTAILAGVS